ncbi:MAG: gamma carbonic anhydrase family protein [Ignavibacteria bacterium]|nr:gamma carbonic anhydrase family protein [Ignavibacteria bacterium]MBT8381793.1 gamma carbonic anhydrase family protein [Ignavibacteria bacterium]MBT8392615.1 gamma carbonic anhydrase family protein [Ignavibacteria bacterium]NNJ51626.1 gamma carbonic anhydrase family protein [Ignavibacteriaceae bacterium]NNL20300.1 gamma carbonic anhydrase family protein [Ignavibacteriaceae bacterium]
MENEKLESSKIFELKNEKQLYTYLNFFPKLAENVFLAPGAKIIGNVEIGEGSSVWYNTVIRGDVHYIKIGKTTNIQDCSMLHVTNGKYPLNIGDKVTIGHSVTLHGCTLQDLCFIGIGAIVLDGAVVESNSMVAAGALVKQDFVVPAGKLVAGVPAKVVRDLAPEEVEDFEASAIRYRDYSNITLKSLKSS